jgi:hypothetical protein
MSGIANDTNMGIFLVIFGCSAVVGGIFGKDFYKADVITLGAFKKEEKRPT